MKTLAQKRQAKKEQANKDAKLQAKICFFSITLIVGIVLYAAITNGIAVDNTAFTF